MQQRLELEALLALVPHVQHRLQTVLAQRQAVHQAEFVWPGFLRVIGDIGRTKAKVQLDRVVAAFGEGAGL